jgi:hypothetical protein
MTNYTNTIFKRLIENIQRQHGNAIKRIISQRKRSSKSSYAHAVRTVMGGMRPPKRKYLLTMSLEYKRQRVPDAIFDAYITHHYEGRLTQAVIDDAVDEFTVNFHNDYVGCEIEIIKTSDIDVEDIAGGALAMAYLYA